MNIKSLFLSILGVVLTTGCSGGSTPPGPTPDPPDPPDPPGPTPTETFTVEWKNWDGTLLETDYNVVKGTIPEYNGSDPTRPTSGGIIYTWSGWDPTPTYIYSDKVYIATFSEKSEYECDDVYHWKSGESKQSHDYEQTDLGNNVYQFKCKTCGHTVTERPIGGVICHGYEESGQRIIDEFYYELSSVVCPISVPPNFPTVKIFGEPGDYGIRYVNPFVTYSPNAESIWLPKYFTNGKFNGLKKLKTINIESTQMKEVSEGGFMGCTSLETVSLPNTCNSIRNSAFSGCTNFKSLIIPSSVVKIETAAFSGTKISSIRIPITVTSIYGNAFQNCNSLTDIYCEASSKPDGWSEDWNLGCSATVHWGS